MNQNQLRDDTEPRSVDPPMPFLSIALFGLGLSDEHLPPVSRETHGPGICGYCGERNAILKTEPRSQRSYCRKCAPGRRRWPTVICNAVTAGDATTLSGIEKSQRRLRNSSFFPRTTSSPTAGKKSYENN